MPKLNVQQNNAGVIQALRNALAIGSINGLLQCDGANNFSAGSGGGGGGTDIDLGITGASVGQVPAVASVDGSGAPTSWAATNPGSGTSLGITGASAGEYAKIKTVDANGVPTSWESGSGSGGGSSVDPATATPLMDGTGAVGTSSKYAREDHRHPTDTTRAPLASPAFTGNPTAPTQTAGNNSTRIATTAFVQAALPNMALYAPLASPALTGTPTAPTAATSTNNTQIATTAFAQAKALALLNRSNAVNVADTNYGTYMARGEALFATETTPTVNGCIAWQYG